MCSSGQICDSTQMRESTVLFFFFFKLVKGLICVNKYKNLLCAQLQNSIIYSRFSNIYFIIAYVQQAGFQE